MPEPDLGAAANVVQVWAFCSQRYDPRTARLSLEAPFPSSVYTGVTAPGRPGSALVRELIGDLDALASYWEEWEGTHPDGPVAVAVPVAGGDSGAIS